MKYNLFLLILLTTLFTAALYGQEQENEIEELYTQAEIQRIEMEIRASTLSELAAWCRSLGLSESGTREELTRRLRTHFNLSAEESTNVNQRIITIESAQTSEYFTIDVIDEDYARLTGNVSIVLRENDTIHRIKADEILFNRTRNIMTARGNVEYSMESEDSTQFFRGHNITVDIDNFSSIIMDGDSVQNTDGTAYRFEGTVISRGDNDVTILNRATISNAGNEEALWSISASRIWLLPGADFAIFNAVLKVGEIPLLYIPFFYYPADEIIFRPVLGYRSREGAFVQTTTYLLGRPRAEEGSIASSGIISSGSSPDTERERHGIFLRSTGRRVRDENETSLKVLIDYYVNLGYYLGVDLSLPARGPFSALDITLGIGFTRTITNINNSWTPFAPDFDGSFDWNYSNLFSQSVPFRYRFRAGSTINGTYGSLTWSIPFYSDPFVDNDFLNRSESMDWINLMQQGITFEDDRSDTEIGSYMWEFNGNISPSFPSLAPYISNINISNISSALTFITLRDDSLAGTADPGRFFFAPDRYTIYNFSGTVTGTLFTTRRASQSNENTHIEFDDPLRGIGTPRSPWPLHTEEKEAADSDDNLVPPALNQSFPLPGSGELEFFIDYRLVPASSTELQFMSGFGRWATIDDVNWNDVQTVMVNLSGNTDLNFNLNHTSGLYSNRLTLSARSAWRDFVFLDEEADAYKTSGVIDQVKIEEARRQNYRQTNYETSYNYMGTLHPVYDNHIFGRSFINYELGGIIVRSARFEDGRNSPQLSPDWGAWIKDTSYNPGITNNRVSANLSANTMDRLQTLTFNANLPPLDGFISASAAFNVWISETILSTSFRRPETFNNEPNSRWIQDIFRITERLRFSENHLFTFIMEIDPELDNEITRIDTTLTLWNLSIAFRANRLKKMIFVETNLGTNDPVWEESTDEPSLIPEELRISYEHYFQNAELIRNRLNFSLRFNTRLEFDLRQYTNSYFQFGLTFGLQIPGFMNIDFTVNSRNNVIFRYFKGVPGMEDMTVMYPDGPQNNLLIDLIDSFNFFDATKRRRSGFNMQNLALNLTHFLGDWRAVLNIDIEPWLNQTHTPFRYEIIPNITFLVVWSPIPELKTDVQYDRRTGRWGSR